MNASDAFQYALRALSARALTERELEKKLKQRKVTTSAITEILERLRDYGFLNDAAIAQRAAENTSLGSYGVRQKLAARGISKHLVEDALHSRDESVDFTAAFNLLERYQSRFVGERGQHKAYLFLVRRGFSSQTIRLALEQHGIDAPTKDC
ncbi:MAG: regulatory protein RecX [Deinococcales bacterium]